jgi:hypothetical protein
VSLFVHVTLPPTAIDTGFGEYAVVVIVDDPLTIETGVPLPGIGIGEGLVEDEPQPIEKVSSSRAPASRRVIVPPRPDAPAKFLPPRAAVTREDGA